VPARHLRLQRPHSRGFCARATERRMHLRDPRRPSASPRCGAGGSTYLSPLELRFIRVSSPMGEGEPWNCPVWRLDTSRWSRRSENRQLSVLYNFYQKPSLCQRVRRSLSSQFLRHPAACLEGIPKLAISRKSASHHGRVFDRSGLGVRYTRRRVFLDRNRHLPILGRSSLRCPTRDHPRDRHLRAKGVPP
jgi:hypothetical protein